MNSYTSEMDYHEESKLLKLVYLFKTIYNYEASRKVYQYIDCIICPSSFMKKMLDSNPTLASKTVVLRNFIDKSSYQVNHKQEYVLYFGAYTEEKGLKTLLKVCGLLSDVQFVFAGAGEFEQEISKYKNERNVGYKSGSELEKIIGDALFSVCPSELNENCPFSVLESQSLQTPVVGSRVGGIPELIKDKENGRLFNAGDAEGLKSIIEELWNDRKETQKYQKNCASLVHDGINDYCERIIEYYA